MIEGIHHTGLTVSDWDRSFEFYTERLGMDCVWEIELDENPDAKKIHDLEHEVVHEALLSVPAELGEGMIEMFCFEVPPSPDPGGKGRIHHVGWTHICFKTREIDSLYEDLRDRGVEFTTEPIRVSNQGATIHQAPSTSEGPEIGQVRATYFYDPDGNLLELIQL